ncbi:MAG TPA: glycosyl hydrolase family 28-related protein, partial [Dyadobacter sp.]|nr:glycosyl hydrolase family 28-related protein [Dyadobacter sp.]
MTISKPFVFASITMILLPLISFAQSPVSYSVKKFGAKGDGKSDDTKAIQEAIDKAALTKNANVVFPSGIYLISNISIKANIKGAGNAIIKKIKMPLDLFVFCNIRDIKSIKVSNITFDGSVVLDADRKVISGSTPLHVYNCQDIIITNCTFKNSPFGGLRLEASKNIAVSSSKSIGSRGVFGDGFYITGTNTVQVTNCIADDYERIGFVTEGNSFNISFTDCLAKNGRNASILSGGIEYNAGFWYENSANIKTVRCTAINNTHRGFVATTGEKIGDFILENIASFEFENCKSINNPTGFAVASFGKAVNTTLRNCSVSNSTT